MELRAILQTIVWWLAWHFTSPFSSSVGPKEDLQGSSLLHLLNHFKNRWSLFHPKRAPNLMASFGFAFCLLYLSVCERGEDKRRTQWSASLLEGLNRGGPLSWMFMSTPLQKHIQITSSSPNGSCDTRMTAGRDGEGARGASAFHAMQLINFHPVSAQFCDQIPLLFCHRLNHRLHKSKSGTSAENIIKMFVVADAGQKAEKQLCL